MPHAQHSSAAASLARRPPCGQLPAAHSPLPPPASPRARSSSTTFVESEARGEGDPFLLWLTGGDRCSSFSGLAYEIGLSSIQPTSCRSHFRFVLSPTMAAYTRLHINPNSWTKVAHILFVDSPVGAGFSFSLHDFLIKWFSDHPKYLKNPFYLGGDSHAGKLVPYIAHIISQGIEAGNMPLYAHGVGIISDQLYEDYMFPANDLCAQALDDLNHLLSEVQQAQILLDTCIFGTYRYYLSYFWANAEATRNALGIKKGSVDEWVRCHNADLPYTIDLRAALSTTAMSRPMAATVRLYTAATMTHWCRTWGHRRGSGHLASLSPTIEWAWHLHGQSAGFTLTYSNNMTFATIKGGGHTAPEYELERCFAMFSRWIPKNHSSRRNSNDQLPHTEGHADADLD
ncbi:hypothetical protein ZWY2020_059508 [Hordeum vulgare]|nr:hypothetical protein ZWY2020_059508 [Hordeum vulgare]